MPLSYGKLHRSCVPVLVVAPLKIGAMRSSAPATGRCRRARRRRWARRAARSNAALAGRRCPAPGRRLAPSSASQLARAPRWRPVVRSAAVKAVDDGRPGCVATRRVALRAEDVGQRRQRQAVARVADEEAVVLRRRSARRRPARGARRSSSRRSRSGRGPCRRRSWISCLGHRRQLADGLVAVVEPGLRVDAEGRAALRLAVAGVGAEHREALLQRVRQRRRRRSRRSPCTTLPSMPPLAW